MIRAEVNELDKGNNRKIIETKSWFFEKIYRIDKPLAKFTKKKRKKTQINKIRNENEVTTDSTEIPSIVRDYYE